jgi:4-hydroxy-3-methylbut-2-enyl diphosphate reductase
MNIQIEIDDASGFCFGVTTAIRKAEEELAQGSQLYCLGDIVHNGKEVERLRNLGLKTIDHNGFERLQGAKVLLRAHGEPPSTYLKAEERRIEIIDATCPVVLQLQKRIRREYESSKDTIIAIFGKKGHAEVLGLVGQTEGHAVVLESIEDAKQLDFSRDIRLFSQTTKPLSEFREIERYIAGHIQLPATFRSFDTICRSVSGRLPRLQAFAKRHDALLFVSGQKSSNGRVLYEACLDVNKHSYLVEGPEDINFNWFDGIMTLGICGATSTPKWLMEACKKVILEH